MRITVAANLRLRYAKQSRYEKLMVDCQDSIIVDRKAFSRSALVRFVDFVWTTQMMPKSFSTV